MAAPRFLKTLYVQVLIATAIGVLVGHFWPATGAAMKPVGDAFVKLVRMIVAPVIFCTVAAGIAGGGGATTVGKVGVLALVYFEIVTTIARVLGLIVVNVVRPGAGMNVDVATLDAASVAQYVNAGKGPVLSELTLRQAQGERVEGQSAISILLDIIPTSLVQAFAAGDILQVLLVSVLFGFALRRLGAAGTSLVEFIERLGSAFFAIVGFIMKTAPLAAFGAMAFTIGVIGKRCGEVDEARLTQFLAAPGQRAVAGEDRALRV